MLTRSFTLQLYMHNSERWRKADAATDDGENFPPFRVQHHFFLQRVEVHQRARIMFVLFEENNSFDLSQHLILPLNSATRRRKENFDAGASRQAAGEKFHGFQPQLRLAPGPDHFHRRGLGEKQPAEPQRHRFQQRHQLQSRLDYRFF